MSAATANDAIANLCPACGLCCNGGLFGDVELQRGDDAERLAQAGLKIFSKNRQLAFAQPCACFDGKLCRIYEGRPKRCAAFECRLLQRVQRSEVSLAAAQKTVRETRGRARAVLQLIRELGDTDETLPLNRRYAAVIAQAIDLSGDEADAERRGKLMLAVAKLVESLERDFLK